jgi:hypothetical protein
VHYQAKVDRIQRTAPAVGRRAAASPAQARTLLAWAEPVQPGEHPEAFCDCLYFAALRPSEAVMLRERPASAKERVGRTVLTASRAGRR